MSDVSAGVTAVSVATIAIPDAAYQTGTRSDAVAQCRVAPAADLSGGA
jgi:hypothetical protein